VADVKEMVAMEEVTYAGSHGLDIVHPDGTAFSHPMPDDYPAKIATLLHLLRVPFPPFTEFGLNLNRLVAFASIAAVLPSFTGFFFIHAVRTAMDWRCCT